MRVRFPASELAALDLLAEATGMTRSGVVRLAVAKLGEVCHTQPRSAPRSDTGPADGGGAVQPPPAPIASPAHPPAHSLPSLKDASVEDIDRMLEELDL